MPKKNVTKNKKRSKCLKLFHNLNEIDWFCVVYLSELQRELKAKDKEIERILGRRFE